MGQKVEIRDGRKHLTRPYSILSSLYYSAIRQGLARGPGTMFTYLHYLQEKSQRDEACAAADEDH